MVSATPWPIPLGGLLLFLCACLLSTCQEYGLGPLDAEELAEDEPAPPDEESQPERPPSEETDPADGDDGPPADGPGIYPACEQRGGRCTRVDDFDDPCPTGSYGPFSGHLRYCPTGSIQVCCIPVGWFGSPCTLEAPCDNGGCLSEQSGYPPDGLCSQICDPTRVPTGCPDWALCLPVFFSQAMGMCLLPCGQDEECRDGWSCQAFPRRPWGGSPDTRNVCWAVGIGMAGLGLGEPCARGEDCLSGLCRPRPYDPAGPTLCSATCGDQGCLPGFTCLTASNGQRLCFPG